MKKTIYVTAFPTGGGSGLVHGSTRGGDVLGCALSEDGTGIAEHLSSSVTFAKHDMGLTSDWKHEYYREHAPDGYELVWIDDAPNDPRWQAALALNRAQREAASHDEQLAVVAVVTPAPGRQPDSGVALPRLGTRGDASMSDWQPIETAPKDGSLILAWSSESKEYDGVGPHYLFVRWHVEDLEEWVEERPDTSTVIKRKVARRWEYWYEPNNNNCVKPSFWMPLPDPPQSDVTP